MHRARRVCVADLASILILDGTQGPLQDMARPIASRAMMNRWHLVLIQPPCTTYLLFISSAAAEGRDQLWTQRTRRVGGGSKTRISRMLDAMDNRSLSVVTV